MACEGRGQTAIEMPVVLQQQSPGDPLGIAADKVRRWQGVPSNPKLTQALKSYPSHCDLTSGMHTPHMHADGTASEPDDHRHVQPLMSDRDRLRLHHQHGTLHEYDALNRLPTNGCLDPPDVLLSISKQGTKKAHLPVLQAMLQAMFAGIYIGFGDVFLLVVGVQAFGIKESNPGIYKLLIGAFGLPFGLTLVVITGASLFTSNTTAMPVAWYHRQITLAEWAWNWIISYFGNFAGALLLCGIVQGAGIFHGSESAVSGIAEYKAHHAWYESFLRGILCNWCVNLAIWQSTAAQDFLGKFVGIFLPISAFVAMGFEHSVANMFLIPIGMMNGADVSFRDFLGNNLIPATIGNILSGWLIVGTLYTYLYGKKTRFSFHVRHPAAKTPLPK